MIANVQIGISEEHLIEIYSDNYISRVAHDNRAFVPYQSSQSVYLTAYVGEKFAGAFLAIFISPLEIEFHSFLKKEANLYCRELGNAFLNWAFSLKIERVTAQIGGHLQSVINYAKKLGFKQEGIKRNAISVNSELKDVYIMGMTRADWS